MVVARGGEEEKLKYARDHLDVTGDNKISKDELETAFVQMLEHTKNAVKSGEWNIREAKRRESMKG